LASRPVVGITTYGPHGEPASHSLPAAYAEAVARAGGLAVLLPSAGVPAAELLARLDALILAGGGDIDPRHHAGGEHPQLYGVTPARDSFELELAREALREPELPLLGICRGMQVMNIVLGGDLELHIPDVRGEAVLHRLPPREPAYHPVCVEARTSLAEIFGRTEFPVCSWHHQEVRQLGAGLRAVARAPDGVIEALVHEERPLALGVQWHPEMQAASDPLQQRLFAWLVEQARRGR
jgi:putative glutamine amidotransferase